MNRTEKADKQLAQLASHLTARRERILGAWRQASEADTELPGFSRTQLNDLIPKALDAFERKLRARAHTEEEAATQQETAAGRVRALMRAWSHLHLFLVDELENYASSHPKLEPIVMPTAHRTLAELLNQGIIESASQHAELEQTEASPRLRDLEQALWRAKTLEYRRAEVLRDATHDLRGRLGVVYTATAALSYKDISEQERTELIKTLQRGMESVRTLLNNLMSMSRLEPGQEQRKVAPFNAAELLKGLCENLKILATERRLYFKTEGPATLLVEGDAIMTQRIAQNLLLNALKYTDRGGVMVTWEADAALQRWMLCVRDTGPGFQSGPVISMAQALNNATEEMRSAEKKVEESVDPSAHTRPLPMLSSRSAFKPAHQLPNEGIGLWIVKRLCALLDATLEFQTECGKGSNFRVVFPRRYEVL